jgi:antagonist of KipI
MSAELHVVRPGALTTVQDLGRWGVQSQGVPVAGPMDPVSHRVANALVGNDPGSATLEVTLIGPEIEFQDARAVAVAGAEFELLLDGLPVIGGRFEVRPGSRLRFVGRRRGARAYLAVAGGIDVPPVLGSRATHLVSRMGGLNGRALAAGDRLRLGEPPARQPLRASGALPAIASIPDGHARVRVMPGPQRERFADDALDILQSGSYRIANDSDRMGYRLEGLRLPHRRGADIISDATPFGVLQVPEAGQPLLLMADRQTTGGYPKIATVITADIGMAGQLGPGDAIAFTICSRQEAISALIAQERALLALERPMTP